MSENPDNWETAGDYAESIESMMKYRKKQKRIWNRLKKWWKDKKKKPEPEFLKPLTKKELKELKAFTKQTDQFIAMGDGSNITKKRENIDYSARDYDGSNRI